MKIIPVKSSAYDTVCDFGIASYIKEYSDEIAKYVSDGGIEVSQRMNRAQLKVVAAELETVCKRLRYYVDGRY